MMYKPQFKKNDPYDWFCGRFGAQETFFFFNLFMINVENSCAA